MKLRQRSQRHKKSDKRVIRELMRLLYSDEFWEEIVKDIAQDMVAEHYAQRAQS